MYRKVEVMPCSIDQFMDVRLTMGLDQMKQIVELGLGGLLHMKRVEMRGPLIQSLIQIYDPIEDKFRFSSGETFSLHPYDVEVVMGLQDKGTIIQLDDIAVTQDIPSVYECTDDGFSIDVLSRLMWTKKIHNDVVLRSFVLVALGTIIAPVSKDHIPRAYYSLVQDIYEIKKINWNALTLGFLKKNLAIHTDLNKWPSGNLALLQYCYWEKVHPVGSSFFFSGRMTPFMKYWKEETCFKRDMDDLAYGLPGGIVVDDLRNVDIVTPPSMPPCSGCKKVGNKVVTMEKEILTLREKSAFLMKRCLEKDFTVVEDSSDERRAKHNNSTSSNKKSGLR